MAELEVALRLGAFALLLTLFWCAEWLAPRRPDAPARFPRQVNNLSLVALNTLILRLAAPLLAVDMARLAAARGWGLLATMDTGWLTVPVAVIALDLVTYWQHRLFHQWPMAWRFHRMHHSDTFFDVTTGVRFHPVEILASMAIKVAAVGLLGAPFSAVILFEVLLNGTALFNHTNLKIPARLERIVRLLIVTPDMHRVHHSVKSTEHNRNFGFNLSVWDRVFRSYQAEPEGGHLAMRIGLPRFRGARDQSLGRLLLQPFAGGSA